MNTRHTHHTRSMTTRALAAAGALALIGAACSTDDAESTPEPTTVTPAADTEPAPPADDADGADGADGAASITTQAAGDIALAATIDFETGSGEWEATEGSDLLGCEGGTFTEDGLAATAERTFTCEDGDRAGTIIVHFLPEPVAPDSDEFVSDWTVHAATGDFAGLRGGGDWAGMADFENGTAEETWTGSIEFGDPADDVEAEAASTQEGNDGVLDQAFLTSVVERLEVPDDADGTITVAVIDANGEVLTAGAGNALDGSLPGTADPVRVGSISKVFTSLATLSLVGDGAIALDDPVADIVTRVPVPDGVTVRDLLQHTSGIPEYVAAEGFFDDVAEDRQRRWTPEEIVALVDGADADFEPGEDVGYSNTNYALLGIVLEEVTGQPAHEVIRERVIDVVGMPSTYLAGHENGPEPVGAFGALPGQDLEPTTDFDYTSIATSAWVAGAIVSSGDDLHRLFTALGAGEVIAPDLVDEMLANEEYGLGIESWDADDSLVGHGGSIAGFETLAFHEPATGRTAYWLSTSNELFWGPIVEDVVFQMNPELADAETD